MFPGSTAQHPGSNTAAYFAARGVSLSPDESLKLVQVLLRLVDLGALSARADARAAHEHPKGARRTCTHRTAERGATEVREGGGRGALEDPTVYNMGPSDYIGAQK